MPHSLRIRRAEEADAAAIASLAGELGYPASEEATLRRLARLSTVAEECVLVAEIDHAVAGWIHVGVTFSLESEPFAEIRGLVVTERTRGSGVGSDLVEAAVKWTHARQLDRLRVRSNVIRAETRLFYERRGFTVIKTQNVFERHLR